MMTTSGVQDPLARLARLAESIDIFTVSDHIRPALDKTLLDTFGVGLAGSMTPEYRSLIRTWPMPDGPSSVWGSNRTTDSQTATLLNGVALCSLELDEGNRMARGHPGAHVITAAVAEAQRLGSSGPQLFSAILAGYEVAARIAGAFRPRAGLHPHGHWGAIGAAVAVGKLYGFDAIRLAEAMDAAAALALASPFSSALDGSFVRNLWVGAAASHGIWAAGLVQAGLGSDDSTMTQTFGRLLGELDYESIAEDPRRPLAITQGYFKRHASCAYTHAAADAAIGLHERLGGSTEHIVSIRVDTHSLAAPLDRPRPATRLAAMFSIPHVVAVALRDGSVPPQSFGDLSRANREIARLRDATTIVVDREFEARLPHRRGARVIVELEGGERLAVEVPHAIGDHDFHPLGIAEIEGKLAGLLGRDTVAELKRLVADLADCDDVAVVLHAVSRLDGTLEPHRGEQ